MVRLLARSSLAGASMLVATLSLAACGLSREEFRTIDTWLTCDECISGERGAVRALGKRAIPTLASALLEGPSPGRRQLMRGKFQRNYASITPAPVVTQAVYVDVLEQNYIANYQKRAVVALGDIGGAGASGVLDDALSPPRVNQYRADVLRLIRAVRSRMGATAFGGSVSPTVVGFGDTVTVDAAAGQPFTGNELAELDDALFPPNEVLIANSPSQLRFFAVGAAGPHTVVITNVSGTQNSETASLSITTPVDANDRATRSCATFDCIVTRVPTITPALLPHKSFVSLWRTTTRPDTADYIRITNTSVAPLSLTANLAWPATNANLDLYWTECTSALSPVGNTDGATTANPEQTSVSMFPGNCWVLHVIHTSTDTVPVFARLRITSP